MRLKTYICVLPKQQLALVDVFNLINQALLDGEQAWTSILNLKSFVMDSVQVGKAVFGKESYTTLGIEPRTYSNSGRYGNPYSVCWVKQTCGHSPLYLIFWMVVSVLHQNE